MSTGARGAATKPRPRRADACAGERLFIVDALRGVAILLMVAYHFTYDLNHFSFLRVDFYHSPFWLSLRTIIVSLFLGLVGTSLVLATCHGLRPARYGRRLALLIASAAAISLVTFYMFPGRMVFFGILHFIAFASVAALPFVRRPGVSAICAVALLVLPHVFQHRLFDQPALQWVGLMTFKPATEDYVPVVPWFGAVLLGIAAGHVLVRTAAMAPVRRWRPGAAPWRGLALIGRHSLAIYLLHQPLLFGLLAAVSALSRG